MQRLLRGTITRQAYVELLRNLADIYRGLEAGLDQHAAHPALAGVDLPRLRRTGALQADIAALSRATDGVYASRPATREYVERLHTLSDDAPELLLAHAYVRYMGDLSGGRILAGIVAKTLDLTSGAGAAFYEFPLVPDHTAFKAAFRIALDDAAQVASPDALVREAQYGFSLHERLFGELE